VKLSCPSCGSPLEFRYDDSFVRVCPACHSAIVRTDRGIDTLGQFADLAPSGSGLSLGTGGRYQRRPFVLVGRAEYAHPAGGSWEEWFLAFDDGRWGWLSHAEGRWALMFRMPEGDELPAFESLAPGSRLSLAGGIGLVVGEIGSAAARGAQGELPFVLRPGAQSRFADASDEVGRVASIDYGAPGQGEAPALYLGRLVEPVELGLNVAAAAAARDADPTRLPVASGERLACPSCGGSIELRVPGRSLRVTCPYCASLLDCEGPLAILGRLDEVDPGRSGIPLGAVGRFDGVKYTVTGRMRRKVSYEGGFFEWEEYLLYAPAAGYRWLVSTRGHFSFVTPLPPGAVRQSGEGASYQGVEFRRFDSGRAEVTSVWGEFYWRVAIGETVDTIDFIAPPAMLSRESSASELHWSLGVYMSSQAVREAFALPSALEPPRDVAANQPFIHSRWRSVAVLLAGLLLVCVIIRLVAANARQVYVGSFRLGDGAASANPSESATQGASYVFFTPPFELSGHDNVEVSLSLPLENDWAFGVVDLIHEESGELRTYQTELEYYSGVDGGERWSEGSRERSHLFSAGSAGPHVLRLEVQTPAPPSLSLVVSVAENVFAAGQLGWLLLLLGLPTALLGLAHALFERWRWSESDYAPAYLGLESDE
jgi:uncharacterized protein DUF4178